MVKKIMLKTSAAALDGVIHRIGDQLNDVSPGKPLELLIHADNVDEMIKTMEVLFDRASVERIKQAQLQCLTNA